MPIDIQERVFLKLFEQCKIANYSPQEYMNYEQSLKDYHDWNTMTSFAKKKAREEGLQEGRQEGLQEGRQEAMENIVLNLLKNTKLTIEEIATSTGLSLEYIQHLQKKL